MEKTYLETLGTWFFGLSNLVLSAAALWLGNRRVTLKPNLSGSSVYYGHISQHNRHEMFIFKLVNRSPYSIKINSITLIFHKKKIVLSVFYDKSRLPQLPATIEPGIDKIIIDFDMEISKEINNKFPKEQETTAKEIKKMRVEIGTSLGPFLINPEPGFIQAISEIAFNNGLP